ncbi:hypothetical protein BDA96_10G288000 [Sorghum bicolor]|uniref:Uncharacterized protein n=1 Tax=Sorghum bicolor TaxID=4558 RepID=A0A921U2F2_SORBI|nr:hypothetical protein BDA96_10G288000 [Sorghum bicolor]
MVPLMHKCTCRGVLFSARCPVLTLDHHAASLLTSRRWRYIDLYARLQLEQPALQ